MSLGFWDLKLTNPKLADRPQLWPVLTPVTVKQCSITDLKPLKPSLKYFSFNSSSTLLNVVQLTSYNENSTKQ